MSETKAQSETPQSKGLLFPGAEEIKKKLIEGLSEVFTDHEITIGEIKINIRKKDGFVRSSNQDYIS